MKIQEIKHNHSLTELLKVILFSILMIMPFLSVASRCLYVICNKNAKDSYSQKIDTAIINVDLNSNFIEGQTYNVNVFEIGTNVNTYHYEVLNNLTNLKDLYFSNESFEKITKFAMATSGGRTRLIVYDENNTTHNAFNISQDFYFVSNGINNLNNLNGNWYTITTLVYTNASLDNAFEYSIAKLEDNQLFNWTKQTAIYTGVQTMCTQLGINNNVIPEILVYWFILSIIYVIIDIVIKCFTVITHMVSSKKA